MQGFEIDVVYWFIWGLLLLIGEAILPGIYLMWWGFSSIFIAGISFLFPSIPFSVLAIFYALFSLILSIIWWKHQHKKDARDERKTSLNHRSHAMINAVGVVAEIRHSNNIIRAKFGDTTWRVEGENLQVGDRIRVIKVEGIILTVDNIDKK